MLSQTFGYDGFGNLTSKSVPAGSSEFALPGVNAAKNWLNGSTYDQNGNVTTLNNATLSYDVENRLSEYTTGSFVENYGYDEANRRVDRWSGTTYNNVYFYGPNGKLLTVVQLNFNPTAPYVTATTLSNRIYFGKMLLGTTNGQVNTDSSLMKDRLGSVQPSYAYGTATGSGEQTSPGDDFATYWKDSSTGFEYAMNRYYSTGYGRFLTVDPFGGSARAGNPGSMNRYWYAGDDPVNRRDPSGLDPGDPTFYVTSTGEPDPSDDEGGPDVGDTDSLGDFCLSAFGPAQAICSGLNPFNVPPGNASRVANRLTRKGDHSWSDASAKLQSAEGLVSSLLTGGNVPAPCAGDLNAIGANFGDVDLGAMLENLVGSVSLQDSENNSNLASSVYPNMDPTIAARWNASGFTVGQLFNNQPGWMALSQLGTLANPGSAIYFDPVYVNQNSVGFDAGMLMHEYLHSLGLEDPAIENSLGVGEPSNNISVKLAADCFPGQ